MRYTKKKIEKKELINLKNNNLYVFVNTYKFFILYNNIYLNILYSNINFIKKYLKEVGFIV
jgi:hypothetical protein